MEKKLNLTQQKHTFTNPTRSGLETERAYFYSGFGSS